MLIASFYFFKKYNLPPSQKYFTLIVTLVVTSTVFDFGMKTFFSTEKFRGQNPNFKKMKNKERPQFFF